MVTEESLLLPSIATYITRCRRILLLRYVMCCIQPVQDDEALLRGIRGPKTVYYTGQDCHSYRQRDACGSQLRLYGNVTLQMKEQFAKMLYFIAIISLPTRFAI